MTNCLEVNFKKDREGLMLLDCVLLNIQCNVITTTTTTTTTNSKTKDPLCSVIEMLVDISFELLLRQTDRLFPIFGSARDR
jgi:hypothetical protein